MPIEVGYVIWGLAAIALANLVYRAFRNRGLRGALFGSPIARTAGELDLGRQGRVGRTLRVHLLAPSEPGAPEIGIEVVARTFGSVGMMVLPLTRPQALAMHGLLSQALGLSRENAAG